jgi:hypothetical protein
MDRVRSSSGRTSFGRESLQWHTTEHEFYQGVYDATASLFRDNAYELSVIDTNLLVGKRRMVEILGELREQLTKAKSALASSSAVLISHPMQCRLRLVLKHQRDFDQPQSGLTVQIDIPRGIDYEAIRVGAAVGLDQELREAARKFQSYAGCLRIVLVTFRGDTEDLPDEMLKEIVETANLPSSIDQVWITRQKWLSLDEWQVAYDRVR